MHSETFDLETFDLIVIGGGPGGSTVATLVAKAGFRVLVLERAHFPRYHIGESLVPATTHGIADLLGIREELKAQGYPVKYGACFRWGKSPEPWCFDFGKLPTLGTVDAGYAYQVERAKFDDLLLKNARRHGVDAREGHSVTDYLIENGRAVGVKFTDDGGQERTARARFIVAASGNNTRLSSWVGERVTSKFFQNVAISAYYEGGHRMPAPRSGQFLAAAFGEGWFWYIPLSDRLTSVGAVVDSRYASRLSEPAKAMDGFIDACPLIKEWLSDAKRVTEGMYGKFRVQKDYSYTSSRFWRNGAVLVGDAACFVDPVFSTGVHLATYSALLAARSINTLLRAGRGEVADDGTSVAHDIDEAAAFGEFEARYRLEYERIYNFLVSFYDMQQDQEGYYWSARRVNQTEERANDAFISLVSGMSSQEFFSEARGSNSNVLSDYIENNERKSMLEVGGQLHYGERVPQAMASQAAGAPVRPDGLVPDGLFWRRPAATSTPETGVEAIRWAWAPRKEKRAG